MRQSKEEVQEYIKKYRLTPTGFAKKTYKDMRSRIRRNDNYKDLPLCSQEDFLKWTLECSSFMELFNQWDKSDKKTCPSIDRLNSKEGYVDGNMEWVTFSENMKRRNKEFHSKHKGVHNEKGYVIKYNKI